MINNILHGKNMKKLTEKAAKENKLSKNEIIELLINENPFLFKLADKIRKQTKGDAVHLRALIEFTNICKQNCYYCGLRCDNKNVQRYRLSIDEIIECSVKAKQAGYQTIVLQGGEDAFFDTDKICKIIKEIKKLDVALTLSIGEKSYEEYKAFKDAGADRYLLRIETTDKELYQKLHPKMNFENRIKCLYNIKLSGFETGTGCLVGLPGQTIESLAADIMFFKELDADMIGIGPFIPHPDTPLGNENKNNFDMALKVMAITRLLLPDINIPATTAMETIKTNGRIIALQSGANVIMPNLTEIKYKSKYELYPEKNNSNINGEEETIKVIKEIESIKRTVAVSKGYRHDIK